MNNVQNELTLTERLQAPASPFFKPGLKFGAIIAVLSAVLVAAQSTLAEQGITIPPFAERIVEIVGFVAAAIAGVSGLTVDFDALKKKKEAQRLDWPQPGHASPGL